MKLKIEIDIDNAAFVDDIQEEVVAVLARAAQKLAFNGSPEVVKLLDTNGNVVGSAKVVK